VLALLAVEGRRLFNAAAIIDYLLPRSGF